MKFSGRSISPGISRAHDQQDVFRAGIFDGRLELGQRFRGRVADEPAPIDDPGPVVRGVADGLGRPPGPGGVLLVPADALGADLEEHHRHVPIDAGDADPVVAVRPDDAQGGNAMPVGLDAVLPHAVEYITESLSKRFHKYLILQESRSKKILVN